MQRNNRGNGPAPGANEAVVFGVLGFYCVFFLFAIAAFVCQIVLYMRMSQTLAAVSKRTRKTEPASSGSTSFPSWPSSGSSSACFGSRTP